MRLSGAKGHKESSHKWVPPYDNRHFRQGWERISHRRGPQAGLVKTVAKETRLEIRRKPNHFLAGLQHLFTLETSACWWKKEGDQRILGEGGDLHDEGA